MSGSATMALIEGVLLMDESQLLQFNVVYYIYSAVREEAGFGFFSPLLVFPQTLNNHPRPQCSRAAFLGANTRTTHNTRPLAPKQIDPLPTRCPLHQSQSPAAGNPQTQLRSHQQSLSQPPATGIMTRSSRQTTSTLAKGHQSTITGTPSQIAQTSRAGLRMAQGIPQSGQEIHRDVTTVDIWQRVSTTTHRWDTPT